MDAPLRPNVISILIVEDSGVVRHVLRELLMDIKGAVVTGEFDNPSAAIESIKTNPPHIVLLDIQLSNGSGLELLRVVGKEYPQVKVIVFTNFAEPIYRKRCRDAGAHAFYDKKTDLQALRHTLQQLASELRYS